MGTRPWRSLPNQINLKGNSDPEDCKKTQVIRSGPGDQESYQAADPQAGVWRLPLTSHRAWPVAFRARPQLWSFLRTPGTSRLISFDYSCCCCQRHVRGKATLGTPTVPCWNPFFFFDCDTRHAESQFPRPGIEPMPLAVEAQSLNHLTSRNIPWKPLLMDCSSYQVSGTHPVL